MVLLRQVGYGLLCVVLPVAWGLMVNRFSSIIEKKWLSKLKASPSKPEDPMLSVEYFI